MDVLRGVNALIASGWLGHDQWDLERADLGNMVGHVLESNASVEVERNATTAPVHPAVEASLAHSASAAARPPPGVKAFEVTNASRPGVGVGATGTIRSCWAHSRCEGVSHDTSPPPLS